MALKDCIKKLGVVSKPDQAKLEQYIADGMTDEQAVRRLLIESSVDVIDIADRARSAGATVTPPKDTLAEIRNLQDTRLRALLARRAKLEQEISELNAEYRDENENSIIFDQVLAQGKELWDPVENMDDSEVLMRISQVMFNDEHRTGLRRGVLGIQGSTPKEVFESWKAQKQRKIDNRKRHTALAREWQGLKDQINGIVATAGQRSFDQTIYHGSPHVFDEFLMEKVGTGEGVQAYGYGLYFAESKQVASYYTQSNDVASIVANSQLVKFKGDRQAAIDALKSGTSGFKGPVTKRAVKILENRTEELGGHVYQVEVDDAAVDMMLDWDAPLSDKMIQHLKDNGINDYLPDNFQIEEFESGQGRQRELTGRDLYERLQLKTPITKSLKEGKKAASEYLASIGVPGIKFLDQQSRTTSMKAGKGGFLRSLAEAIKDKPTRNMVLFSTDPISEVKRDGELVYERDKTLDQEHKGQITFDERGKAVIGLLEAADQSTFIHEAGHLYLELLGTLAERPDATEQTLKDWETVKKYLGVSERGQIKTEHHELWARSFERYAMEGKAPAIELRDAFNAFRRWLGVIYRHIKGVRDIELPAEISAVMDRMIATDEEIALAEQQQEYAALFTSAEQMGVSEEVFELYKSSLIRAHNEAVDRETAKLLKAMKRDQQSWYEGEREKMEAKVRAEVYAMRAYRAISFLTRGKEPDGSSPRMQVFKLDRDSLLEALQGDTETLKRLPHTGQYGIYRKEGGVDVDVAAQALGYVDGQALVEAILRAAPMEDVIKAETLRRMEQTYPDPFKDGTLAESAVVAVHSERRAQILAAEMRQLRQLQKQDKDIVRATKKAAARETRQAREANKGILPKRAEVAMIKRAAQDMIARRRVRDLRPNTYLNAERKAGRLAFEAATKGDFQAAYKHKRQQLINHEMYRAAIKAKERTSKARDYVAKFESKAVQKRLGRSGVLDKILAVLESVDLRRRSLTDIDRQNLQNEMKAALDTGELVLPPGVLERMFDDRVNWQELEVWELDALQDLLKQLEMVAKKEVEAIVNGEKVNLQEAADDVAKQLFDNNDTIDFGVGKKTKGQEGSKLVKQGVGAWLRPSSLARVLDKSGFGAITRRIIVPMRKAYSEKLIPNLHKAQADIAAIYRNHYDNEKLRLMPKKRIRIDSMDETFSHADLLALALNWGNAENQKAVLAGMKRDGTAAFPRAGVNQMLAQLTEADWAFVQEVWDYLDSYWPEIAEAEKRRRGIAPKKVEAVPFTIRTVDGTEVSLRGGYYPLKYAPEHSDRTKMQDYQDYYKDMLHGVYVTANTRAGSTYERIGSGGQVVRLDLNIIDNHLREIIRDLAVGDETNYLKRLLNRKDVRDAFIRTGNETALETLNLWLTDAAVGELPAEGFWEQTTAWIRTGFTKAKLGWNLMTTMLQFTGWTQSMAVIGSANMASGLGKFMSNPATMWADVMERSKFLNTRYDVGAWDKDVQDTKAHLESFFGSQPTRLKVSMNWLAHTYFLPIAKAQQVVDITTWLGAYEKGRNELNLDDADATIYADTQVEAAQTSGFFSDRSGLERGTLGMRKNRQSQYIRIWTTLISYMLAKGNIAYEKTKATNFRKPSEVITYAMDLILLYTVEGIASALLYSQLPEDDEPEDIARWVGAVTLESAQAGIPFVREVYSSRFSGGNTPLGSFAKDLYSLGVQIEQGENDAAARRALANVVGTAFHVPSGQLGRTLESIWFEDDPEWYEYISGVRDE